jgi:hypothetical protein
MNARPSVAARPVLSIVFAALVTGCATGPAVRSELGADGVYHLRCATTLQVCLNQVEELCHQQRYVVLRALDLHEYAGDTITPTESRHSEAFVRCGARGTWGDANRSLMAEPLCPAPTSPPAAPPARLCTPGASQACVGAAGCKGGQACGADGNAFGPCDCGGAPSAAPTP